MKYLKISLILILAIMVGTATNTAESFGTFAKKSCWHNGVKYATILQTQFCESSHSAIENIPTLHQGEEAHDCLLEEVPEGGSGGFQ